MPRPPDTLPDFWVINEQDRNKIRCKICVAHDPRTVWMARQNRLKHERSQGHQRCIELEELTRIEKIRVEAELAEEAARLAEEEARLRPLNLGSAENVRCENIQHFNAQSVSGDAGNNDIVMFDDEDQLPLTAEEEDKFIRQYSGDLLWTDDFDELGHDHIDDPQDIEDEEYHVESRVDMSLWDKKEENWFPYPSKTMFLIDLLGNLPRLRISSQQMILILWIMRECGAVNVPTYSQLRTMTTKLHSRVQGVNTSRVSSSLGNIFYVNDIRELIARDIASPHTAPLLEFYPVEAQPVFSETWHGKKIHELDQSLLTPMARQGFKHFYVKELAQLIDGSFVIPVRWVKRSGELCADAYKVLDTNSGLLVETDVEVSVPLSKFDLCWLELENDPSLKWTDQSFWFRKQMPNALRTVAEGDEVYTIFINVWADDVSGNASKQMNPHKNIYVTNASLPGRLLQQEFHVKFVSTSQHASTAEQMHAIRELVNSTHRNPHRVYNPYLQRYIRFRIVVAQLPCDNPQASEECSHIGAQGNFKCRKCKMGGTAKEVEKEENYHALHETGPLRTVEDTRNEVLYQLDLAAEGVAQPVKDRQTSTGIKDKVAQGWIVKSLAKFHELRQENRGLSKDKLKEMVKNWVSQQAPEAFNPLLNLKGVDPHRDTPVELLHTMLLGVVKYFWHNQNQIWKDDDREQLAISLRSLSVDGLGIATIPSQYMIQYRNNLIGKHFRILMQLLIFASHALIDQDHLILLTAMGKLGAHIWVPEIYDLERYLIDLNICVGNLLDAFDKVDSGRIIDKQKMHILVHAASDVMYHGPLVRSETETFECYNHVFRLCSILSNRQAPSKDIAAKFARMECTKHIISGGYWPAETEDSEEHWVQAGPGVLKFFDEHEMIQQHLGWVRHDAKSPGIFYTARKTPHTQEWELWNAQQFTLPPAYHPEAGSSWREYESTTAVSQDICKAGSWVFFKDHDDGIAIGKILHLVGSVVNPDAKLAFLQCFNVGNALHQLYQTPVLRLSPTTPYIAICPKGILFLVNVQHDCSANQCRQVLTRIITQEREHTKNKISMIEHANDNRYILNTYALHNHHRLWQIPQMQVLLRPQPLHIDRQNFHHAMAIQVQARRNARRLNSAAKNNGQAQHSQPTEEVPASSSGFKRRRLANKLPEDTRTALHDIASEEDDPGSVPSDSEDEQRLTKTWSDGGINSQEESEDDLEKVIQIRSRRARPITKPRRYED